MTKGSSLCVCGDIDSVTKEVGCRNNAGARMYGRLFLYFPLSSYSLDFGGFPAGLFLLWLIEPSLLITGCR